MALASETEHPHSAFVWWAAIAVPAARGDWAAADTYARMAAAEPIEATDRTVPLGMTRALVATARGDAEAVLAALEPVAALSPNPGIDEPGFWPWHDLYGDALVALGRAAEADAFLRAARSARRRARPAVVIARLARVRGRVEATLGRREQATAAFKRALEHVEPLGLPYEQALIQYAHGQFLRRNGRRRAAADELTRARDTLADSAPGRAGALRARAGHVRAHARQAQRQPAARPDAAGTGGGAPGGDGQDQPRGRRRAVAERQDGRGPSHARVRQARGQLAFPARREPLQHGGQRVGVP